MSTKSRELLERSKDLRKLLETAPDAIVVVDSRGEIVFANQQTESLFGFTAEELLGESIQALLPERFRDGHARHLERFCANPQMRPMGIGLELWGQHRDGKEFPVEISLSPIRIDGDLLVSSAIRDATRRRELESRLRQALEAAEAATATKSRFIAAASHDLRQPLQAASLYLELAGKGDLDRERLDATVEKARRCVDSLSSVLDKVLHISRLDAGGVTAHKRSVEIGDVLLRLAEQFAPQAAARGVELRVARSSQAVYTDPVLLFQILENLVSNAVHYTERGRVLLGCRRRGGQLAIQVWDSGVGISEEQLDRIFEEFHRVNPGDGRADEGLGLGLSIVRRLAEILGHPVRVESRPGKGSLFELVVPRALELDEEPDGEPLTHDGEKTVAVLDDDAAVLDALAAVLEMRGYQVVADSTLPGLLRRLRRRDVAPAVLLSDYRLGEAATNGLDAIEALRREYGRSLGAILLTGDSSFQALVEKSESGDFGVLAKPVDSARLSRELERRALLSH